MRSPRKAFCVVLIVASSACGGRHAYEVQVREPVTVAPQVRAVKSLPTPTTVPEAVLTVRRAAWLIAEARTQDAARARQVVQRRAFPTSGVNHAPHSEAWWHGVAICEQGGRNDSFFGYFSYMDGSEGGGKPWAEQVARGNRTIAQYGDHAWAQSCINAGYRAAPSG